MPQLGAGWLFQGGEQGMQRSSNIPRWLWWFLGCSVVIGFIVLCSCGIGSFFAYRFYRETVGPPITLADVKRMLPDLPIYPNAELDEMLTNFPTSRMTASIFTGDQFALYLAFQTQDPLEKVLEWYRREMKRRGWREFSLSKTQVPEWAKRIGGIVALSDTYFARGGNGVFFQTMTATTAGKNSFALLCSVIGISDWEMKRLEERVKRNPDDSEAWASLAFGYFCAGEWAESQKALKEALEKSKSRPIRNLRAQRRLAKLLLWVSDDPKVLPIVRSYGDHDFSFQLSLAKMLLRLKRWREAEQTLTSALVNLTPEYEGWRERLHTLRGIARWHQGKRKEAVEDFERAYRLNKSSYVGAAWAYGQMGNSAKAKQILLEAAKANIPIAQNFLKKGRKAVWLGILPISEPDWLSGRWMEGVGIKGEWAVEVFCFPTRNSPKLNGVIIFAINGQPIRNWQEYRTQMIAITERAKAGDKVTFSVWRNGKVENVDAVFEPFLP
jgi:tetratricopeptide (TPR) repeat protein